MSETAPQAKDIFLDALSHVEGDPRNQFLDRVCGPDSDLRRRVERLIAAHELPDSMLDRTEPLPKDPSLEHAGQMIGPYKILQKIGEGGMGTVFMAEQQQPVKRRVALKVIKPGMDTKQVLARFEAERQALAMMDHPNIAKVLEAGTTENGRPYFVMELVKGVPITQYCDDRRLSTRERLSLFIDVCHAVQHAHQKGIIHRDLKPSNILVAKFDDEPVVKVIDFGVAKAINQELTQQTLFTDFGQVVGTLEYMSPEQAQFNQLDIDTRSDIYSLGVLLYELLAGQPPFDRQRFQSAALDEVMRIIREEEPPKPSTRLSTLGQKAGTVSEKRGTDASGLERAIRGDVDWMVMKSLDKDRERRYETANEFAADVRRYLDGEPIQARPPSSLYRMRRFASRNKGLVASASIVSLALGVGLATSLYFLREAYAATNREQAAANEALEAQSRAEGLQRRAEGFMRKNQELFKEQILLTILGGDHDEAMELLAQAAGMGIPEDWRTKMASLVDINLGNSQVAMTKLESLGGAANGDTVALALLCTANGLVSNEDLVFSQLAELKTKSPVGFEENLLVGGAMMRWLPREGVEYLKRAQELRPFNSVVQLALQEAECWVASTCEDPKESLRLAQRAVDKTEALMLLHNNGPQIIGGYVQARMVKAHALARAGDLPGAKSEMNALPQYIDQLQQFPASDAALWWPAMVGLMRGDDERVLHDFETRPTSQVAAGNYIALYLAAVCFETNQHKRGKDLQDLIHGHFKEDTSSLSVYVELAEPGAEQHRQEISKSLQERMRAKSAQASSKFFFFFDWTAFMMLGDSERAHEVGEELYQAAVQRNLFPEEIACADFMRGDQPDPVLLLEQCRDSQLFEAYAHWVIGFELLSQQKRDEAEVHFGAIERSGDFQHGIYWWGKAFHSRVSDEAWLPWLNSPESTSLR